MKDVYIYTSETKLINSTFKIKRTNKNYKFITGYKIYKQ